jgi:serine phosphatase RsbU (regulator of sigma subunit)/transcription elongation factor Elf1
MQCLKKNCRSTLTEHIIQLKEGIIHYFLCNECYGIWLDQADVNNLGAGYGSTKKIHVSDYPCPRCKNVFLESVKLLEKFKMKSFQCRKCNGLRIETRSKELDFQDEHRDTPLLAFLYNVQLVYKHEMYRKKANQLPKGFKIENAQKTDFKCPNCSHSLTQYHVFETNLERGADYEICDECFGIWLDKEDLVDGKSVSDKDRLTVDMDTILPTNRTCPKCRNTELVSLKYKELDTIIDCCASCFGTWLDGGELQEFCDYLGKEGQEVIDILIDNNIFRDPSLCRILDQFNRILHQLENQKKEQEKNLQQARDIQVRLLFQSEKQQSIVPHYYGDFKIVTHWQPAQTVGGDYFDIIPFKYNDEDYLGICIADVSGKGLPASLLMANLQALLRAFAPGTDSPAKLCTQLNTILHQHTTSNKFITFFYGVLNLVTGSFTYTNAGHNPPIHYSTGDIRWLKKGGTVLSFFPEWKYEETTIELLGNDRVLLYTDGISETENFKQEEFGEARLAWLLKDYRSQPIMETMQLLVRDVQEYNQGKYRDDSTLLLLERSK